MMQKMKGALDQASPETVSCLKNSLGEDGYAKLQNGEAPKPEEGDIMRKCFESMKVAGLQKMREGLKQMPPEIRTCLEDKLGKDKVSAIEQGQSVDLGPETAALIQDCTKNIGESMMNMMQDKLKGAPPEIQDCIKSKITADVTAKLRTGAVGPDVIQGFVTSCMANFKPNIPSGGFAPENIPAGFKSSDIPVDASKLKDLQNSYGPGAGATPPAGLEPTTDMCANFSAVPSCSYVPAQVQDLCKKCKGE